MFQKKVWSLKNPLLGWIITDISVDEAKAILFILKESERTATLVWRKDWTDWKNYQSPECLPLQNFHRRIKNMPPGGVDKPFEDDLTVIRAKETRAWTERKYERLAIRLPATVVAGRNQFRTFTENVSLGGLCLVNALPSWVAGYCTLIVELPDGHGIELVCTIAEDQSEEKKRLEIVQSLNYEKLREWIATHDMTGS